MMRRKELACTNYINQNNNKMHKSKIKSIKKKNQNNNLLCTYTSGVCLLCAVCERLFYSTQARRRRAPSSKYVNNEH